MEIPRQSWLDPRVIVGPSQIEGNGLFAAGPIDAGETVIRLGGELLTDAEVRDRISRGERYNGILIEQDVNLSLRPQDWIGIFGNHSCEPNIWLVDRVDLQAMRDIDDGEEITSDYATYTMMSDWSMKCACGAPSCRGIVTGDDWMRPDVQAKYRHHFAAPIARCIVEVR